ncbi:hypothetical protein QBC45DRAFT_432172 [Copromyces sp. CBS 386.78]|nr:hypothetical protein QBC45DRAFT_432172 [Copromyces sp. CBS 386.78]
MYDIKATLSWPFVWGRKDTHHAVGSSSENTFMKGWAAGVPRLLLLGWTPKVPRGKVCHCAEEDGKWPGANGEAQGHRVPVREPPPSVDRQDVNCRLHQQLRDWSFWDSSHNWRSPGFYGSSKFKFRSATDIKPLLQLIRHQERVFGRQIVVHAYLEVFTGARSTLSAPSRGSVAILDVPKCMQFIGSYKTWGMLATTIPCYVRKLYNNIFDAIGPMTRLEKAGVIPSGQGTGGGGLRLHAGLAGSEAGDTGQAMFWSPGPRRYSIEAT